MKSLILAITAVSGLTLAAFLLTSCGGGGRNVKNGQQKYGSSYKRTQSYSSPRNCSGGS